MLSDTPVEERENLNNNITQAIENHKNNPNEQIDFRRNGTETMDNLITKLEECQTLENFKHTLNDPRYSHISRQPNSR
ncbi:hypothetical protein J5751_07460 [bacterium]|nr:hypothetical protein [bacterium]